MSTIVCTSTLIGSRKNINLNKLWQLFFTFFLFLLQLKKLDHTSRNTKNYRLPYLSQ